MQVNLDPRLNLSTIRRADSLQRYVGNSYEGGERRSGPGLFRQFEGWLEGMTACPWGAHAGFSPWDHQYAAWTGGDLSLPTSKLASKGESRPLYTAAERARRDASRWTQVQAVLAPLQFAACAVSLLLIVRYLTTGHGYALTTGSILLKTAALYAIMITGSIWEKDVFGKWLFAPAFFWEDVVSMLVLGLQTTYVIALLRGWGSPAEQMAIAIAAYAAYAVNASQFLMKLRAARQDAAPRHHAVAA